MLRKRAEKIAQSVFEHAVPPTRELAHDALCTTYCLLPVPSMTTSAIHLPANPSGE